MLVIDWSAMIAPYLDIFHGATSAGMIIGGILLGLIVARRLLENFFLEREFEQEYQDYKLRRDKNWAFNERYKEEEREEERRLQLQEDLWD